MGRDLIYRHEYFPAAGHEIHAYANAATSDYHALLASYTHRLSRRIEGRLSYTWSRAIDTDSGESLLDTPPPAVVAPWQNRGPADYDRRHVLDAWMSYRLPTPLLPRILESIFADWQIDGTVLARSGAPMSVTFLPTSPGAWNYDTRVDLVAGVPLWLDDSDAPGGRRLNRTAFQIPSEARQWA